MGREGVVSKRREGGEKRGGLGLIELQAAKRSCRRRRKVETMKLVFRKGEKNSVLF